MRYCIRIGYFEEVTREPFTIKYWDSAWFIWDKRMQTYLDFNYKPITNIITECPTKYRKDVPLIPRWKQRLVDLINQEERNYELEMIDYIDTMEVLENGLPQ